MLASPSTSMSCSSASTGGYASARTPELSEILPNLYISDVFTASDEVTLEGNGITHVISVMQPCPWLGPPPGSAEILEINVEDSLDDTLLPYFETTNAFIQQALEEARRDGKKAKVLCHCLAGISRSVTCVVAYLMYACKMSKEEALNLVREKRPIADPNLSFLKDLDRFEAMLKRANNLNKAR